MLLGSLAALALIPLQGRAQRTLHAVPNLTIDASAYGLSTVGALVASSSGIIAVLQPKEMLIRFFTPVGSPLGSVGGDGEGAGEFRSMGWAAWQGDTLRVDDSVMRRVTFIGPDRKVLRIVPPPVRVPRPPRRHYPSAIRILVGMDHSVWLEEHTTVPGIHAWRILDAKGIVSGVLTVPASIVLTDVRINAAWGTDAKPNGLRDVVRFEVY